jgi:hypothetical protein
MSANVIPFIQRFWAKIDKRGPDECWPWLAGKNRGYGCLRLPRRGPQVAAHRVSWELHNGPIPGGEGYHGVCVLHRCDNPACVNPKHLFLGTAKNNSDDMIAKGRKAKPRGEINGQAKLTETLVRAIKRSPLGPKDAAARFGISKAHVWQLRTGRRWSHVQ